MTSQVMLLRLESVPSSKDAFGSCLRRQWKMDVTLAPIRPQEHPETPHDNTDPPTPLDPSALGLSKFETLSE